MKSGLGQGYPKGPLKVELYSQGSFKTELCQNWQSTGMCRYKSRCQYAHGIAELRPVIQHHAYKTKPCRSLLAGMECRYGDRCHFLHNFLACSQQSSYADSLKQEVHSQVIFNTPVCKKWHETRSFHDIGKLDLQVIRRRSYKYVWPNDPRHRLFHSLPWCHRLPGHSRQLDYAGPLKEEVHSQTTFKTQICKNSATDIMKPCRLKFAGYNCLDGNQCRLFHSLPRHLLHGHFQQLDYSGSPKELHKQGDFKTKLCRNWKVTGWCAYRNHCQFAHGISELRPVIQHPSDRTKLCQSVLAGKVCPFGVRCHFLPSSSTTKNTLIQSKSIIQFPRRQRYTYKGCSRNNYASTGMQLGYANTTGAASLPQHR